MNLPKFYSKVIQGRRIEFGLAVGLLVGLMVGMAVKPSTVENNKVVKEGSGLVSADEVCASIYGGDYGHGEGLAQISCFENGSWYDLGVRDLTKALNSSYTLGDIQNAK